MKKIIVIVKRIILSFLILYGYNLIAVKFNLIIPINIITTLAVGLFGFPMLFVLVLLRVLMF